ncbi:MAG: Type 1 glutamine amidotransferase-like domain-containing protein [Minicystis sp.]
MENDHGSNGALTAGEHTLREGTDTPIRPLFLLADSQLLFWKDDAGRLFLARVREALSSPSPKAAYLGASNGDVPDYYDIFVAAMEGIGIRDTRMIPSRPSDADRAFFEEAEVILLAGGDAARGLRTFQENGLAERILARYAAGAVIIGISAGAMQLGLRVWSGDARTAVDGFRLAPVVIGAHDEPEWTSLTTAVEMLAGMGRGIGIPSGGGAVVHADLTVEPVRKALVEIGVEDGVARRALLVPGSDGGSAAR